MAKYVIEDKFGPVGLVSDEFSALHLSERRYSATVRKVGYFESRKLRKEISERNNRIRDITERMNQKN